MKVIIRQVALLAMFIISILSIGKMLPEVQAQPASHPNHITQQTTDNLSATSSVLPPAGS